MKKHDSIYGFLRGDFDHVIRSGKTGGVYMEDEKSNVGEEIRASGSINTEEIAIAREIVNVEGNVRIEELEGKPGIGINHKMTDNGLARDIDVNNEDIMYDASIKAVLANKQILARILKYSLSEFADKNIGELISWIDEPQVSKVNVDPGMTNNESLSEKVILLQQEDSVHGEGLIRYDIRFNIFHKGIQTKFIINVEAQKSSDRGKLHYDIDNRVIFYIARMVSAQKETEFFNSDYDEIKPVRSIWICMDAKEGEESISRIKYIQEAVYGKPVELANIDKPQGIIIRINNGKSTGKTQNKLINMLEELIRDEDAEIKKRNLSENYGIVMSEKLEGQVNTMCNWSEAIEERGIEKGIDVCLIGIIIKKSNKNCTLNQIANDVEEDISIVRPIYETVLANPGKNADEVYEIMHGK